MRKIDLTGQRFDRLVVLCENGRAKGGKVLWLCKCDCGAEVTVQMDNLRNGHTTSCGCFKRERSTRHGLKKSNPRLYKSIHAHFRFIQNAVGCYEGWQIDSRYTSDATGVSKFCEDLIALRPDECERYEKNKSLEIDKDSDRDHIFRPETVIFVTHTENCSNRKCTLRLEDGTALTDFCRSLGIETCSDNRVTRQYAKYRDWFTRHNGEGHHELLKKANEVICIMRKCLEMLKLLKDVRAFKSQYLTP